jgi:hypothetical protein
LSAAGEPNPSGYGYVENPDTVDNPILSFFLLYWRERRGANRLPTRADMRIRDFPGYLPWVILLDAEDEYREFRFRVVGTRVAQYFLSDATGSTLSEAYQEADPELREGTRQLLQRPCLIGAPTRATGPASTWQGNFFPNWDALYLPLGADRTNADSVFVAFTFNYQQFRETRDPGALRRIG